VVLEELVLAIFTVFVELAEVMVDVFVMLLELLPPVFVDVFIAVDIFELLDWVTVVELLQIIFTSLLEPAPLPDISIFVSQLEGVMVTVGVGVRLVVGVGEIVGETVGVTVGDGVPKLSAVEKVLFVAVDCVVN